MHTAPCGVQPHLIIAGYEPKSNLEQTFYQRRFSHYVTVALWAFVRPRRGRLVLIESNCPQAS